MMTRSPTLFANGAKTSITVPGNKPESFRYSSGGVKEVVQNRILWMYKALPFSEGFQEVFDVLYFSEWENREIN